MNVNGPVLDARCDGEAAGGEPAVEPAETELGFCKRARREERTGKVSIESGERPSGSGGGFGDEIVGEVAIAMSTTCIGGNRTRIYLNP